MAELLAPKTLESSVYNIAMGVFAALVTGLAALITLNPSSSTMEEKPKYVKPELSEAELVAFNRIMEILKSYSPSEPTPIHRGIFEETVRDIVQRGLPLHMVLPAFPAKSPNHKDKVLGPLPDLGEYMALARLEGLCVQLEEVYPNVEITIVSDGIVYNDILGVTDTQVYHYGQAIRKLAAENYPHIKFARLSSLLSMQDCPEAKNLEEYLIHAPKYRETLVKKYTPKNFQVDQELNNNVNAMMTYLGYTRFLEGDLRYEESRQGASKRQITKMNKVVAKQMIERGAAFSAAVQYAFPSAIRLSIHPSESAYKKPIALLPGEGTYTTPWHCSPALELDGSLRFSHSKTFLDDPEYELVFRNEQPYYFRRKSDLYRWDSAEIDIEPIYPCGLKITPKTAAKMRDIDMKKIRALAELCSPVLLRGFQETKDLDMFKQKGKEMGTILPWKFGEVLVVKDVGEETGGFNIVRSAEPLPFHFDGSFKTKTIVTDDGTEKLVPDPPHFQFFTAGTDSPKDSTGRTLLASSRIIFELLPAPYTLSQLKSIRWGAETNNFIKTSLTDLELVMPHPTTGAPCLRYHEAWPQEKTAFDPIMVEIENGSKDLQKVLDSLLYDRRVCYYHAWLEGDLLVSDNLSMLHTRNAFKPGHPRELWRIHID